MLSSTFLLIYIPWIVNKLIYGTVNGNQNKKEYDNSFGLYSTIEFLFKTYIFVKAFVFSGLIALLYYAIIYHPKVKKPSSLLRNILFKEFQKYQK